MRKKVFVLFLTVLAGISCPFGMEAAAAETAAAEENTITEEAAAPEETETDGSGITAEIDRILGEAKGKISGAFEKTDEETAREIFDFVKGKVSDGSLKTEEGLLEAIKEGENKFGVSIDEETARRVVAVMEKLEDMGFSGEDIIEKSKELYEAYGAEFMEHADEVVTEAVEEAVTDAVGSFFRNLWEGIKNFFQNLFKSLFGRV